MRVIAAKGRAGIVWGAGQCSDLSRPGVSGEVLGADEKCTVTTAHAHRIISCRAARDAMSVCCPSGTGVLCRWLESSRRRRPGKVRLFPHRRHRFAGLCDGDGASKEFAVTGSEGVIGVASSGGRVTPSRAVVLARGRISRCGGSAEQRVEHDGPLPDLLLRYTLALMAQIGQIGRATGTIRSNGEGVAGSCHASIGCPRTS